MKGLGNKSILLAMGLGLVCCTLAHPVLAVPVPILNPGFELPSHASGGFGGTITDWQDGDGPLIDTGTFNPTTTSFPSGIPEGSNVAYSSGPFISQVLSEPLTAGATYTLGVDVGNRSDVLFAGYEVQLRAGGVTLATSSGPQPNPGEFTTATVNFTAPAAHAQLDKPLQIRLLSGGVQAIFDNVRLDTTLLSTGVPLTLANADFEQSGHSDGQFSLTLPGWDLTGSGLQGDFNPLLTQGQPTVGELVAFSNGGTISQILTDVLNPSSRYVLTVDLVERINLGFPVYQVQLLAGGQVLAEDFNSLSPLSDFLTSKVEFSTGAAHPMLGEALEIRMIAATGGQALYDNVRLTVFDTSPTAPPDPRTVPEPATAALGLIGLGMLLLTLTARRTAPAA